MVTQSKEARAWVWGSIQEGGGYSRARPKRNIFLISFQNEAKLVLIQKWSSRAKKFDIKYGCEGIDLRNNFPHRNFS
jgi:hypothetical protein